MSKKKYKKIFIICILVLIIFIIYAFNHPEKSLPFNNNITYAIYILYICLIVYLFIKSK